MKDDRATNLYGLLAEFDTPQGLLEAARRAKDTGYLNLEAFSPFAVEGLSEFVKMRRAKWIPRIVLAGGIFGGTGAFLLQYYAAAIAYPLNIGGRPLNSWQAFVPITFELTILVAALFGAFGMFWLNGLPLLFHPVFTVPQFRAATSDRFFLCVASEDEKFDEAETRSFLESLKPLAVIEVWNKKR